MSSRYPKREHGDREIDEVLNRCDVVIDRGKTKFQGMTYEEGVKAGIEFCLETGSDTPEDFPFEDESELGE